MNKKMTIMFVLFACMVALSGCTSESDPSSDNSGASDSVSDAPGTGDASLTEMERYAIFEAEFACSLMAVNEGEDMQDVLNNIGSLVEKHGFTADDIERLKTKYEDNPAFADVVLEEMKKLCPEDVNDMLA